MISAVIAAAGRGQRMGADKNKVLLSLKNRPVIWYTVSAFLQAGADEIIVVTSKECLEDMHSALSGISGDIMITEGGKTRQESVLKGIKAAGGDYVCIHDGARAFVTAELIRKTIDDCMKFGAAAPGVKIKDTVKKAGSDRFIEATVDREALYLIQTPQVFKRDEILKCHMDAERDGLSVTDDCSVMEHYGHKVYISEGSYDNIKLTTPEDMETGEQILNRRGGYERNV